MRYRLRTLLASVVVLAIASGAVRIWYDRHVAEGRRQHDLATSLAPEVTLSFSYVGPRWPNWRNLGGGQAFSRATVAWCEDAHDFAGAMERLRELPDVATISVLARQIMPHVAPHESEPADAVIATLRAHPALTKIIVDASIRGAPLDPGAKPYDNDDLAKLRAALPNLEILWIEVN